MEKISGRLDEPFVSYRVNGRTDTLTDFRVYSLFEYTKKERKNRTEKKRKENRKEKFLKMNKIL